jgi:hypothetical protein
VTGDFTGATRGAEVHPINGVSSDTSQKCESEHSRRSSCLWSLICANPMHRTVSLNSSLNTKLTELVAGDVQVKTKKVLFLSRVQDGEQLPYSSKHTVRRSTKAVNGETEPLYACGSKAGKR